MFREPNLSSTISSSLSLENATEAATNARSILGRDMFRRGSYSSEPRSSSLLAPESPVQTTPRPVRRTKRFAAST